MAESETPAPTEASACDIKHLVVYAGVTAIVGGPLGARFFVLQDGAPAGDAKVFSNKKKLRHLVIGGVYELMGTATLDKIVPDPKWVRLLEDADQVAAWRVASDAARAADRSRKDERLARRVDQLRELLEPIRKEYRRPGMTLTERMLIELAVLRALRAA